MKYTVTAAIVLATTTIPAISDAPSQLVAKLIDASGAVLGSSPFTVDTASKVDIDTNAEGFGFTISVALLTTSGADAAPAVVSALFDIPAPVVFPPPANVTVTVPTSVTVSVATNPVA